MPGRERHTLLRTEVNRRFKAGAGFDGYTILLREKHLAAQVIQPHLQKLNCRIHSYG